MLIPSDRHSDEDLRVWAERERLDHDLAHHLPRLVQRSVETIREFASQPCYAGVSWGKDSVVMADLVARHAPQVPLVYMRWRGYNPDCLLVRDAFLAARPSISYEEIDSPEMTGTGFERALARFGPRYISGVRAQESRARALRCQRWGIASPNTCAPLSWWRVEDIFSYLAVHDLPVHPAYACSYGGALRRDEIRVDHIGWTTGTGRGRREWEWTYYRDECRALGIDGVVRP